jgi:hypothetical protein
MSVNREPGPESAPPPSEHPAASAPVTPPPERPAAPVPDPESERIRAEREQWQRDRELWMAERDQTRQWQRQVEQRLPPPPVPAQPDIERIWYENPRQAMQLIRQDILGEVTQQYRLDQEAQKREQIMRDFVGGMYESHPELRGEDQLVAFVLQRDGVEIGKMRIPEARAALAKGVRDEIFRMERRASEMRTREEGHAPPPAHRAIVEGGSASRSAPRREAEDSGAKSITELLRMRREARDNARHGQRKAS